MGSPQIAVPALKAIVKAGHEVLAVFTQSDKAKGRGKHISAPPIKTAALALALPVLQPLSLKDKEVQAQIRQLAPELICVVAYGKILPPELLQIPPLGCLNIHFSLLPKYRGAACIAMALRQGENKTGTTAMLMDEGLDTGPILLQWEEKIFPEDTSASLAERLSLLGAQQILQSIDILAQGKAQLQIQDETQASYAPQIKKQEGCIAWSQDAQKIWNLYRAMYPWPGVFSFFQGKRVIFEKLSLGPAEHFGQAGEFRFYKAELLQVQCGHGTVFVHSLKQEGKKLVSSQAFMRGLQKNTPLHFDTKKIS